MRLPIRYVRNELYCSALILRAHCVYMFSVCSLSVPPLLVVAASYSMVDVLASMFKLLNLAAMRGQQILYTVCQMHFQEASAQVHDKKEESVILQHYENVAAS
jgi:hypothetical protein